MNIGFVSTRLAGTDGVSLETAKLAHVLRARGNAVFYCAGELDGSVPGLQDARLHFTDAVAQALGERAFGSAESPATLLPDIAARAAELAGPLRRFLDDCRIDFLIVQNAWAIPMQLPLAQALATVVAERALPTLAHNHDLWWERDRFAGSAIEPFLDTYFPPDLPTVRHAAINSLAQAALRRRRGLAGVLVPNVFDFATPPPGIDAFNADFRAAVGLSPDDRLILQPTRVIPRKGIELAIELVARLDDPRARLVITHAAGDEGIDYLHALQALAAARGVDLRYVADVIGDERGTLPDGRKRYALWDAYPHADFVTYPSLIEGFGNALLEAVYFRRPMLVNRYAVYVADIAPLGFRFVEIDGEVTDEAVAQVRAWLVDRDSAESATTHNFALAERYFSYSALEQALLPLLPAA